MLDAPTINDGVGYETGIAGGKFLYSSWTVQGAACNNYNYSGFNDVFEIPANVIIQYGSPSIPNDNFTQINRSILTPEQAYSLDIKFDDGLMWSGELWAANGLGATNLPRTTDTGLCGDYTGDTPIYDFTNATTVSSQLGFTK